MKPVGWRLAPALILAGLLLAGCSGLPDDYRNALRNADGPAAMVCSHGVDSTLVSVLGIENPGDRSMEIRSVEFVDASPQPVDFGVLTVPANDNPFSGAGSTGVDDDLASDLQEVPVEVPPGFAAEIMVVLHPPADPTVVNYVKEIEVTVAVGDNVETATFESIRMAGTEDACDAFTLVTEES